ncbi:MAG TPA: efflux RND transporter periplasmic adaptor subunit [Myxococcaceae bacterium]
MRCFSTRGAAAAALALAFACSSGGPGGPDGGPGGGRPTPVAVAQAQVKDVPVYLDGLGTVAAALSVQVKAQVDGRLEQVLFKEGQEVKKGQVLAQIDARPFLAQLHQAQGALARDRAQLEAARRNLERNEALVKEKLVAVQQVDDQRAAVGQAEGQVQIDEAAVETAQLNVSYSRIASPLDGVTGIRQVDPGNLVHASDALGIVLVTQMNPIALLITVPADELPRVVQALARGPVPVEAYHRDGKTKLGQGEVALVDNQINTTTSTVRLKAVMENAQRLLWPNQFVKAKVLLETRKGALVVPSTAVQRGPQGAFVYVVGQDRSAAVRPVEVGAAADVLSIITRGLSAGETVVVDGQNQLRPGAKVEPRQTGERPAGERPEASGRAPRTEPP